MATQTLSTGVKKRGNPGGTGIYYGTATVTITGVNTSGTSVDTYSKSFRETPTVVIGVPKWSQTTSGSTNYLLDVKYTGDDEDGLTFSVTVDTAPGAYKTVTVTLPFTVYGEQYDS